MAITGCAPASRGALDAGLRDAPDARFDAGPPATATHTSCPDGGTGLDWVGFAAPFFETYCHRCHGAILTTADDFATEASVRRLAPWIDAMAAIGPDHANREMPLEPPVPTDEERRRLGEWLACGAP